MEGKDYSLLLFHKRYHMPTHHEFANTTTTPESMTLLSRTLWSGVMVGDALGAPAEFNYADDVLQLFPNGLDHMVAGFGICRDRKAGEVTDDTQMA